MPVHTKGGYLGGEKLFPLSLLFKSKVAPSIFDRLATEFPDFKCFETFGAHSSLLAIVDDLKLEPEHVVLVPSYICSSALKSFQLRAVKIEFYPVDEDLNIDVQRIAITVNVRAVLFVDYMGKSNKTALLAFTSLLREKNIAVIQDVVHTPLLTREHVYGDYVFNSFRKITPLEGSIILTKREMSIQYSRRGHWSFLRNKRVGQVLRYLHLKTGLISPNRFMIFFHKAEDAYYDANIYKLPVTNKYLLERIPFEKLASSNRKLYALLFAEFKTLLPAALRLENYIPFGFFIVVNQRADVLKKLQQQDIFCPIHWHLPAEVSSDVYPESWQLSKQCFTIPFTYPLTMATENILQILRQSLPSPHTIDAQ